GAVPPSACHHARAARRVPDAEAPESAPASVVRHAALVASRAALAGPGLPAGPARLERRAGREGRTVPPGAGRPAGDLRVGPARLRTRAGAGPGARRVHPALLLRREPRAAARPRVARARRAQGRMGDGSMSGADPGRTVPLLKRVLFHSGILAL